MPGVTQAALRNTQNVKFNWLFFICGDANIRRKRTAGLLNKLFRQHSEIKTLYPSCGATMIDACHFIAAEHFSHEKLKQISAILNINSKVKR
jgi:hypothetical protein